MGAEPFFLKQHYKDVLAFLDRESAEGANICNVWVYNFEHELAKISKLLKKYTYIAMVSAFTSSLALSSFWLIRQNRQNFYKLEYSRHAPTNT